MTQFSGFLKPIPELSQIWVSEILVIIWLLVLVIWLLCKIAIGTAYILLSQS